MAKIKLNRILKDVWPTYIIPGRFGNAPYKYKTRIGDLWEDQLNKEWYGMSRMKKWVKLNKLDS